jgi:glutaredoxin
MLAAILERLRADKWRSLVHERLAGAADQHPTVRRVLDFASTVNDLLGKPIRGSEPRDVPGAENGAPPVGATSAGQPAAQSPVQLPVIVYFDGKDHRSKTKVEELLRGREIVFQLLDVGQDEAERSWVTTAARREEFPIVVIAGTPVGGLAELTELDVNGELKRRVFAPL